MPQAHFYVVVEDDPRQQNNIITGEGRGWKMYKIYDNAVKRLKSAALTEPGKQFYLCKVVASAKCPHDLNFKEYKT